MKTHMHVAWHPEPLPEDFGEFAAATWWDARGRSVLTVGAPPAEFEQMTLEEQAEAIGAAISRAILYAVSGGHITEFRSPTPSL